LKKDFKAYGLEVLFSFVRPVRNKSKA